MVSSSERSRPPRAAADGIDVAMMSAMVTSAWRVFDEAISRAFQAIGRVIASGKFFRGRRADGLEGIVIDLRSCDDGHLGVRRLMSPRRMRLLAWRAESGEE